MKRTLEGTIVSDKMQRTVVVKTETFKVHPKYRKRFRSFKKYKAETGGNVYKTGDRVLIEETRPLSKDKCWRVKAKIEAKNQLPPEEIKEEG